jgi:hypothetical protein
MSVTTMRKQSTAAEVYQSIEDFLALAEKEGRCLRFQRVNDSEGCRLTVAFDWDFDPERGT